MSVIYLESSAVVHWLLGQSRAAEVRQRVDQAKIVLTSALTLNETERVLIRAEHQAVLKGGDAQRLRGLLGRVQASWTRMAVTSDVLARAGRAFPVEPIRTLDAIHLATALEFVVAYPDLQMLSFDERVLSNAESLGIA